MRVSARMKIAATILTVFAVTGLGIVALLFYQGRRPVETSGEYVALGCSFAAGLGLGAREPGSPWVCMRSTNGYPHVLARLTGLRLVDMTCSGSTTEHIPLAAKPVRRSAMISCGVREFPSRQQTLGRRCFAKCTGNSYHRHATRGLNRQWGRQAPAVSGPSRDRAGNPPADGTDRKNQPKGGTHRTWGNRLRQNGRRIDG